MPAGYYKLPIPGGLASSATPKRDGIAAAGVSLAASPGDHVHPTTSSIVLTPPVLTGAVTVAAAPDARIECADVAGNITGWTITGLEINEGCEVIYPNTTGKAVSENGLSRDFVGSMDDIAGSISMRVRLVIQRTAADVWMASAELVN